MKLPDLLPESLNHLKQFETLDDVHTELIRDPWKFVLFFETALGDETWTLAHLDFIKKEIEWLNEYFFEGKLALDLALRAQSAIHDHYTTLQNEIPKDLTVHIEDSEMVVNSMLFAATSGIVNSLITTECTEDHRDITIATGSLKHLENAVEFSLTGKVKELWKKDKGDVLSLIKQADDWQMSNLVDYASDILKRYIDKTNVIDLIIMAKENTWYHLYEICLDKANHLDTGVRFRDLPIELLGLEFHEFRDEAMDIFESLKIYITHIAVIGKLSDDFRFSDMMTSLSQLKGISLRHTEKFTDRLYDIPPDVSELDLAMCPWLKNDLLKELFGICPKLLYLNLSSDTELSYRGFSELRKQKGLEELYLSRCHQIGDNELKIIMQCCPELTLLDVSECELLTDASLILMGKLLTKLTTANLSKCQFTDVALIDFMHRSTKLTELDLTRAINISDHGITEAVRQSHQLKRLVLKHAPISQGALEKIKKLLPYLDVIS